MAHLALHPDLKTQIISIFLSSVLFKFVATDISTSSLPTCARLTLRNSTAYTPYRNNLLTLFSNLANSSSTFYNSTAGESPNKAYALYLCRGDVSSGACRTCVKSITDSLSTSPGDDCEEGFWYINDCMIHYSNNSFFGISNNNVSDSSRGKFTTTNYVAYNTTLQSVLKGVITDAANNSTTLFAKREGGVEGDGQEKVYALAQCTLDLDRGNCSRCLNAAFATLNNIITLRTMPGVTKSAAAFLPSCQLRYDNVTLDVVSSAFSSPPTVLASLVATLSLFLIHLLLC